MKEGWGMRGGREEERRKGGRREGKRGRDKRREGEEEGNGKEATNEYRRTKKERG